MNPYRYTPEQNDQPETPVATTPGPSATTPVTPAAPVAHKGRKIGAAALVGALFLGAIGGGMTGAVATARFLAQPTPAPIISAQPREQRNNTPSAQPTPAPAAPSAQVAPAAPSAPNADQTTVAGSVFAKVNPSVVQIRTGEGSGSGFVVDQKGLILTNNHVVEGNTQVTVMFADGQERRGQVLGTDSNNDLAVVKVDLPDNVQAVALGDSDQVKVGEIAIAIGSPFGLDQTLTQGIISAVHRNWNPGDGITRHDLLQTDAPINPGNSGGPLLNANGEVIGINTMIESPVRGSVGVGFAIPINTAKQMLPRLEAGETIQPAWLGISGQDLADAAAQGQNVPAQAGALVAQVVEDGPAAQAGLQAGDAITAIDGNAVQGMSDLAATVSQHAPGDKLTLTVIRNGASEEVTVTLGARPAQAQP